MKTTEQKREEMKQLLADYEQACKDHMEARGNSMESNLVQAFVYAGITGSYSAYIAMLLAGDTRKSWIIKNIKRDIEELKVKAEKARDEKIVDDLIKEYKADPNCWPDLWIRDVEGLTPEQRTLFINRAAQRKEVKS